MQRMQQMLRMQRMQRMQQMQQMQRMLQILRIFYSAILSVAFVSFVLKIKFLKKQECSRKSIFINIFATTPVANATAYGSNLRLHLSQMRQRMAQICDNVCRVIIPDRYNLCILTKLENFRLKSGTIIFVYSHSKFGSSTIE